MSSCNTHTPRKLQHGVQFGSRVGPQINARASFLEELAAAPRFASGRYAHDGSHTAWAVTLVTSSFNLTAAPGRGPRYVLDNVTLWHAPTRAAAAPYIAEALESARGGVGKVENTQSV